jgi:hypothetical protein
VNNAGWNPEQPLGFVDPDLRFGLQADQPMPDIGELTMRVGMRRPRMLGLTGEGPERQAAARHRAHIRYLLALYR